MAAFCMLGKVEFTRDPERAPPFKFKDLFTGSFGSELDCLVSDPRVRNPLKNDFLAIPDVRVLIAPCTKLEPESLD